MGLYRDYAHAPRIWEHETAHIAYSEINSRVRVKRDMSQRITPHQQAAYQVEICDGSRWIPITAELPHANSAFRRAWKIATRHARLEESA